MTVKHEITQQNIHLEIGGKVFDLPFHTVMVCLFAPMLIFDGWALIASDSTMYVSLLAKINKLYTYFCVAATAGLFLWRRQTLVELKSVYLLVPPVAYWLMYYFNKFDPDLPVNVTSIVVISLFLLLNRDIQGDLFRVYRKFLIVTSVIAIVAYVLYWLGFDSLFRWVGYYSGNPDEQYVSYGLGFFYWNPYEFRICGHFNEPGFFGTIVALILCADDLDLRKIGNWILFIAGCLTMSLAFFVIVLVYFVLKFLTLAVKKPKLWLVVAAVLLFYFFVLPRIQTGNYTIDTFLQRFVIVDGRLLGDNRTTDAFDVLYNQFWLSDKQLFGFGDGYLASQDVGHVLIYKVYILEYGVIGFLLIFGTLILNALIRSGKNLNALYFVAVFALSIYQRPNVIRLLYFVVLFGGIVHANSRKIRKTESI